MTWTKQSAEEYTNKLYKNILGTNAVFGSNFTDGQLDSPADADYWTEQLMSGAFKGDGDLAKALQGSSAFKARHKFIEDYRAANDGADPEEALIDANIGPGGVRYATADNPTANLQDSYATNSWLQNFGIGENFAVQSNDPLYDAKSNALAISNQSGTVPGSLITALPNKALPNKAKPTGGSVTISEVMGPEPPAETPTPTSGGGGGGYSGPSLDDFKSMLLEMFDSPWTPVGYGWGGTNADAVRINRSQGSRSGRSYAGNKSSFNRSGSRLSQGTPWMNTLGM